MFEILKVVRLTETESTMVVAMAGGQGNRQLLYKEYRVSIMQDEKVLEIWAQQQLTICTLHLKMC